MTVENYDRCAGKLVRGVIVSSDTAASSSQYAPYNQSAVLHPTTSLHLPIPLGASLIVTGCQLDVEAGAPSAPAGCGAVSPACSPSTWHPVANSKAPDVEWACVPLRSLPL